MHDIETYSSLLKEHIIVLLTITMISIALYILFLWSLYSIIKNAIINGLRDKYTRDLLAEISWKLDMLNKLDQLNTSKRHSFAESVKDTLSDISSKLDDKSVRKLRSPDSV